MNFINRFFENSNKLEFLTIMLSALYVSLLKLVIFSKKQPNNCLCYNDVSLYNGYINPILTALVKN